LSKIGGVLRRGEGSARRLRGIGAKASMCVLRLARRGGAAWRKVSVCATEIRKPRTTVGAFYARCKIENPTDRSRSAVLPKLLVDTGSEYTWIPERTLERLGIAREKKDVAFVMANGQQVTRSVGFAIVRLDKFFTIDEIVFAERGDLLLLGARTLEGLNLTIDPARRKLVAAGPLPAAPFKGRR
jgi:predicted aspartyl protease